MEGRGVREGRCAGIGPRGDCVCPKCGHKIPHRPGKPCRDLKCPECGTTMLREGSRCQHI